MPARPVPFAPLIPFPRPGSSRIALVVDRFEAPSDELLQSRALLRRTDTKFVVPENILVWILAGLSSDYLLLRSSSGFMAPYRNLYLDTPGLRCFHDHRRDRRARYKVRYRHYPDRELTFLEVKCKQASGVTSKQRMVRPHGDETYGPAERAFVSEHCRLPADELVPAATIAFKRLTLVGRSTEERITIDLDLEDRQAGFRLDGLCVLEVKQRHFRRSTPIMRALRAHRIRPASMSKYCTAVALTRPGVRRNRLAAMLRKIERMRT
jgi:hypothetical protein